MTASMDFCVGFTPDETNPLGVRPAELGDGTAFDLEGRAYLEWDEDRPKAFQIAVITDYRRIAGEHSIPVYSTMPGPLADMALKRINQDEYALMEAWRMNQDGEATDAAYSRYEAAE